MKSRFFGVYRTSKRANGIQSLVRRLRRTRPLSSYSYWGVQCPHDLRPLELLNGAEIKQGNWNEQDSVISHIPSMVSLVPLICICDASVWRKGVEVGKRTWLASSLVNQASLPPLPSTTHDAELLTLHNRGYSRTLRVYG
jgi:hypothetical protein